MWHNSVYSHEKVIRSTIYSSVSSDTLFSFDEVSGEDASQNGVGELFKQDENFFLIGIETDETIRSSPVIGTPIRVFGSLYVSFFTKETWSDLTNKSKLEQFCKLFSNKVVAGVRFKPFTPTETVRISGFTQYSGFISFNFDYIEE